MIPKRIREMVETCQFPPEQVAAAMRQCQPILSFHVAGFTALRSVDEQMQKLALDCYIQGLLDGNQIQPVLQQMTADLRVTELPGGGIVSTVAAIDSTAKG